MCGLILVCCRTLLNKVYLNLHVRGSASNLVPVACLDNPNRKLLTHWLLYTGLGHAGQATQVFFKSVVWMHYCSFLHVMKLKKRWEAARQKAKTTTCRHSQTQRLTDKPTALFCTCNTKSWNQCWINADCTSSSILLLFKTLNDHQPVPASLIGWVVFH